MLFHFLQTHLNARLIIKLNGVAAYWYAFRDSLGRSLSFSCKFIYRFSNLFSYPLSYRLRLHNVIIAAVLHSVVVSAANANGIVNTPSNADPEAELHIGRLVCCVWNVYSWGPGRPWWRIDWPEAEFHFSNGVSRYTAIDVAPDRVHLTLIDDAIFDCPCLFAQQVGRWRLSDTDRCYQLQYEHGQ